MEIDRRPQTPPTEGKVVTRVTVTFVDGYGNLRSDTLCPEETEGFLAAVDDQLNEED